MGPELDAWFDQFSFSFHSSREDREVVLPFRILVLGDFGTSHDPADPAPVVANTVTVRNFDEIMAAQNVELCLPVADVASQTEPLRRMGITDLRVRLDSIDSFHPENLLIREPSLARIGQLIARLKGLAKGAGPDENVALPALEQAETAMLAPNLGEAPQTGAGPEISRDWLDFVITDLEADLNLALNSLLHHPVFQCVEATWRGLHWLVTQSASDPCSQIDFASVSRARLHHDLAYSAGLEESDFFELLYTREYGQYGGRPYGAVIGDYSFGYDREDIDLIRRLGSICGMAHCPFISAVAPAFFDVASFDALSGLTSLQELMEGKQYLQWRNFQQSEAAAYVLLTLPHILLRDLWRYEDGGVSERVAEEMVDAQGRSSLWGNAAFAMASCLLRSFRRFRVCTHLSGPDGGRVSGLPEMVNRETGETLYPLEILLSENREAELITMGLAPLNVAKASHSLLFQSANSLRWGYFQLRSEGANEPLGARLGAQLPYLFIILRIAHYLRVIYRENLGSTHSLADLKGELMSWLKSYVSDVESPAPAVRARRPLRNVALIAADTDKTGEWRTLTLVLTPHIRFGGQEYSLEVDMAMNQADKRDS
jgi:type VI secretion system protein ImpC